MNNEILGRLKAMAVRCRENGLTNSADCVEDAIVEIDRLSQEREGHISHVALLKASLRREMQEAGELRGALQPFAKEFADWDGVGCWDEMTLEDMYGHAPGESSGIKFSDLRRAAATLEKL